MQRALDDQNAMLYQMLEKVNDDRERRIREKNLALMKKIKKLERKKARLAGGNSTVLYNDESSEEELEEEIAREQ